MKYLNLKYIKRAKENMKFYIEFSGYNLIKFCDFIYMCNKIFTKTGIIMTIIEDSKIRIAPDPYKILDTFQQNTCTIDSIIISNIYYIFFIFSSSILLTINSGFFYFIT